LFTSDSANQSSNSLKQFLGLDLGLIGVVVKLFEESLYSGLPKFA
jgi:hypothetical protein